MKKYIVKGDRVIGQEQLALIGETVYDYAGWDYGCANDDTRYTGVKHVTVTKDPNGGTPFFTIPERDLEPVT